MKEAYRVIYHILLFVVLKIDYFSIYFYFYDIVQVLFFWYLICILCKFFFYHYAESKFESNASLVSFVILELLVKFFGTFFLEQYEKVPIYCEVIEVNFL